MLIENARLSFPNLFQATSFQPDQKKKYSATFIIDADSNAVSKIKAEMEKVAKEKWGAKATDVLKSMKAQNKLCLRDGAEKADMDGFGEGTLFISASTDKRPGVYDRDKTPLTEDDDRPYAGCYVNGIVELWAQDNQYGRRINAQLRGVQFAADGERFGAGGAPATSDDFPALEDEESAGSESDWL